MFPEIEKLKTACEEVRRDYCRKRNNCEGCYYNIAGKSSCGLLDIELVLMRAAKSKNERIVWNYDREQNQTSPERCQRAALTNENDSNEEFTGLALKASENG